MPPSHDELWGRATELLPKLKERAPRCEELRRLPDETLRDFHDTQLLRIGLHVRNGGSESAPVRIRNKYTGEVKAQLLPRGGNLLEWTPVPESFGWYDLVVTVDSDTSFRTRIAGHVETGRDSMSDPKLGGVEVPR